MRPESEAMDPGLMAYCGTYCATCDWKDRVACKGCKAYGGAMFWGSCAVAACAIGRGYAHCGECPELPCDRLRSAFEHPEHGDNGERLANLLCWRDGLDSRKKTSKRRGSP